MRWLLGLALVGAFGSLAAARYISGAGWLYALVACGAFCGLGIAIAAAMILRRARPRDWLAWAALIVAAAAIAARATLLAEIATDPGARQLISFWRIALAASSVVWGALALIWGTRLLAPALDAPRERRRELVAGVVTTSASLYALAPLWTLLGMRINHVTVIGLFALAVVAWLLSLAYNKLTS
ncbi:MAG: hypothetical protein KC503_12935 [Myxococcales bacterium]|nr:hypothetical protein [Myxococcales bacterium]